MNKNIKTLLVTIGVATTLGVSTTAFATNENQSNHEYQLKISALSPEGALIEEHTESCEKGETCYFDFGEIVPMKDRLAKIQVLVNHQPSGWYGVDAKKEKYEALLNIVGTSQGFNGSHNFTSDDRETTDCTLQSNGKTTLTLRFELNPKEPGFFKKIFS